MARQITRDRKLTPEEAAKYRKIGEEVELEKPEIIAKAQRARREARRQQLATIMQGPKATREVQGLSLADAYKRTGMDRSALSKLENVTNETPTIDTLLRYAEVVGKRLQIQVVDSQSAKHGMNKASPQRKPRLTPAIDLRTTWKPERNRMNVVTTQSENANGADGSKATKTTRHYRKTEGSRSGKSVGIFVHSCAFS